MNKLYTVLAVIAGIILGAVIVYMRADFGTETIPTPEVQGTPTNIPSASPQPEAPTTTQEVRQPTVREYVLAVNDKRYSPSGPITASAGDTVRITFNVSTTDVYYGGMLFRGGPVDSGDIDRGGSKTVEFVAETDFTITAYWPSSGVIKYTIPVQVQ